MQITSQEPPLPPKGKFSEDLRDFCQRCLQQDPNRRPTALQLMSHPFVTQHRSAADKLPAFLQSASNPHSTFDELALLFAHQYYQLLTAALAGDAAAAVAAIEPLYQSDSIYRFTTDARTTAVVCGQEGIVGQLQRNLRIMRGFGVSEFQVKTVDCCGMPELPGGVLLHIQGRIVGRHGADEFAEVFALTQQSQTGQERCFCIAHQSFASLRTP